MANRPRILLAIAFYNGRAFVPRVLDSAKHIHSERADVDVLVLDDCSPEPGFSELLAKACAERDIYYYRSPRNLGIVRNVNLGLLAAVKKDYDFVIISNSDVIYSKQVVDSLLETYASDPTIGSVTAWSNNVSIYSLPNADPDFNLANQDVVDWLAASLAGNWRGAAVDVPAGISFCILIPTRVVREVGLMDPVFGRGYCEETDWTLRSLAAGYRVALAPSAFVYHQGRGSTLAAGMVSGGHSTVPANEAVIDYRYPLFRSQVDAFVNGGILTRLRTSAVLGILRDAGQQYGYEVDVSWLPGKQSDGGVRVVCTPNDLKPVIRAFFKGFEEEIPNDFGRPGDSIRRFFSADPKAVSVRVRGTNSRSIADTFGVSAAPGCASYPERV